MSETELKKFFESRKGEVEQYFIFLNSLNIDTNTSIKLYLGNKKNQIIINKEQTQIFKSNCFLLLYNLIEGTVNKSLEYIFYTIEDKNLKNIDVRKEIKGIWLKHSIDNEKIYKDDFTKISEHIDNFTTKKISIDFNQFVKNNSGYFYSGNLSDRSIREKVLKKLGINSSIEENKINYIKECRNDLAHGNKSFSEISHNNTLSEINDYKNKTFIFLEKYVNEIETYIHNKNYLI